MLSLSPNLLYLPEFSGSVGRREEYYMHYLHVHTFGKMMSSYVLLTLFKMQVRTYVVPEDKFESTFDFCVKERSQSTLCRKTCIKVRFTFVLKKSPKVRHGARNQSIRRTRHVKHYDQIAISAHLDPEK
jgi:hypothetical protein